MPSLPRPRATLAPAKMLPKNQSSPFTTSHPLAERKGKGGPRPDRRVTMIRYTLHHPTRHMPRPLRFSRLRHLRHWTITRAWSLFRASSQKSHLASLEKQYNSMRAACEDLRVNCGEYGERLYRQAMNKKGTFGGRSDLPLVMGGAGERGRVERGREGGVPVEYARGLVDTLGRGGWDGGWTR
ncbi:hypothetical protein MMC10_006389 [Thelotrema lepadinum]|nr:hypothetical protein [Thelotrema lepadinum]